MKIVSKSNSCFFLSSNPENPMHYYKTLYRAKSEESIPFTESKEVVRLDGLRCKAYKIEEEKWIVLMEKEYNTIEVVD